MKITIDLKEFWLDGDQDLNSALKKSVKEEVLASIKASIKEKVEATIESKIKETIKNQIESQVASFIADYIKVGKVKSYKNSNEFVTIEKYVEELYTYQSGWGTKTEEIKNLASKLGTEMKSRYDLLFASQLVAKMNESGLLKKEAAKLLLETK